MEMVTRVKTTKRERHQDRDKLARGNRNLAKEFCVNIYDEMNKGHAVVFRPPPPHVTSHG